MKFIAIIPVLLFLALWELWELLSVIYEIARGSYGKFKAGDPLQGVHPGYFE